MANYYRINSDDVTYRIIDNQAVILNLKTGEYYGLDETGTFIWKLLAEGIEADSLMGKVVEEFGIDRKTADCDIKLLLKDLVSEKIVKSENLTSN